ncbi:hypothetical protein F1721_26330 [Saccharopolyspora hirsuta]|uniref:Nudix hydrolase domain-containing protein n=1 Tax=Saccharopolyspora hirsuta TaxID=1837 RepID=A0A5M7BS41_SACHI|nr:hypothetical protein [Saccharopolyspora hirsuta]KAA5829185.1 hypothetical protein F1721_26330 [Saccharopolyspora hirsuta]
MRKLLRRARSKADYTWFLAVREWPVLVSALGVLLGAITILPSAVGVAISVIALLLGTATFVRDFRNLRQRWSSHEFSLIAAPFPHEQLPPPAAYPDAAYSYLPNRGTALLSDEIDRTLRDRTFTVRLADEPYRLPPILRATAPHVLPIRARGRLLFNGPVVGLRTDPLPGSGEAEVVLHRARFFDFQCSNELCAMRITNRETGEDLDPRRRLLTDASGRIRPLTASILSDVVGISTLAFTTDGKLLLVGQSDRNTASPLLLAPSGSGSLEPRDLVDAEGTERPTLAEVLRTGMERELCEETGLSPETIASTELTGFARWMERGAKPEFFAVTHLSVSSTEVRDTAPRGAERLYSSDVTALEVDLPALSAELRAGTPILEAPSLPPVIRDVGSLPLLLALRAVGLFCQDAPR